MKLQESCLLSNPRDVPKNSCLELRARMNYSRALELDNREAASTELDSAMLPPNFSAMGTPVRPATPLEFRRREKTGSAMLNSSVTPFLDHFIGTVSASRHSLAFMLLQHVEKYPTILRTANSAHRELLLWQAWHISSPEDIELSRRRTWQVTNLSRIELSKFYLNRARSWA